jgi:hypothetical protein
MTWLTLSLAAGILGFALGRWTATRGKVRKAQSEPSEFRAFWGGEL